MTLSIGCYHKKDGRVEDTVRIFGPLLGGHKVVVAMAMDLWTIHMKNLLVRLAKERPELAEGAMLFWDILDEMYGDPSSWQ